MISTRQVVRLNRLVVSGRALWSTSPVHVLDVVAVITISVIARCTIAEAETGRKRRSIRRDREAAERR